MRCPQCDHDSSRVIDSRPAEQNSAIRRRRVCEACEFRFTTYERVVPILMVVKRSGVLEAFNAEKLRRGVEAALADRPVPDGSIDQLIDDVEMQARSHVGPVPSDKIGRLVLERLRGLDEVASLRFASVYKDFRQVEDFERELAELEASLQPPEG